jgi:hypothetical protein
MFLIKDENVTISTFCYAQISMHKLFFKNHYNSTEVSFMNRMGDTEMK